MEATTHDIKSLIAQCAKGEPEARVVFQETYGALIYSFPMRHFRLSEDDAAGFYIYVFENERIFRRIRSFEGRQQMQFQTYLSYYVLRDLCLEWLRTADKIDTISLDAPLRDTDADGEPARALQDVLASDTLTPEVAMVAADRIREVDEVLAALDEERRLILKLLALGSVDLEPEDVLAISRIASRSISDTLGLLDEVVGGLSAKAIKLQEKRDTLHRIGYWILSYQQRIATLNEHLEHASAPGGTRTAERLAKDKGELERKLAWRYQQQYNLRRELQKADVRPSYKDIATLLNVPLGTVASRIARAREAFVQRLGGA